METTKEFTHHDPSTFATAFENTILHRTAHKVLKMIEQDPSLKPIWVMEKLSEHNAQFKVNCQVIEGPTEVQFSMSYDLPKNKMTVWVDEDEGEHKGTWSECKTQKEFVEEIANWIFGVICRILKE